jgi:3-methylcrotonyl-CoA carboxylase alpha subunit
MSLFRYLTAQGERQVELELSQGRLSVDGESYECDGRFVWIGGRRIPFWTHREQDQVSVWLDGEVFTFDLQDPRRRQDQSSAGAGGSGRVTAQMPGKILSLAVKPGDTVERGQNLLVMESMKMELALDAPLHGTVESVEVSAGQLVAQGDLLVRLAETSP